MSLIYRDYICTSEIRKQLLKKDEEEIKREEEILREKYNIDNIFKDRNNYKIQEESKQIIQYKESWFKKILNKLKSLFKR